MMNTTKRILVFCAYCFNALYGQAQSEDPLTFQDSINSHSLETITVLGTTNVRRNNTYSFSLKEVKPLVSVVGETDVLRYIGTLPGVSQGMEGGLGFFVRGSNTGNNRIELDDVPVYGSDHLFGLFSTIPSEVVDQVTFRNGKLPAISGDFLSSLVKIATIQPDAAKYRGNLSVSPFMAGLSVNGPLIKNRLSFQAAGRISLLRPEIQLIKAMTDMEGDVLPEVADLYVKVHYQVNHRHAVNLSHYYSNDYFKYRHVEESRLESSSNTVEENWGNKIVRLSWNWKIKESMQLNTMVYYNYFASGQRQRTTSNGQQTNELRLQTLLQEWAAQSAWSYRTNDLIAGAGLQAKSQQIRPAAEKVYVGEASSENHYSFNPDYFAKMCSGYADLEYKYKRFTPSIGYRINYYFIENQRILDNNLRLALAVELSKETGLEISYDQLSQFHHIVEGLPTGWSLDLILPSTPLYKPEKARQYYAGGFWSNKQALLSAGVYYKNMDNLTSYKNASNIFGVQNANWMDEVVTGKGESYGLELRAEKREERWNAAASYTLSKTDRLFADINQDKKFPFKFDRRHILNLTGQVLTRKRESSNQQLNMMLAFSSGHHITLPIAMYQGIEPPYWRQQSVIYVPPKEEENALYRQLMSGTNEYLLPSYLRVDISYSFLRIGKRFTHEFVIGIFNVLNRHNPYLIFYEDDRWKQLSIFPILPSVKWSLSF